MIPGLFTGEQESAGMPNSRSTSEYTCCCLPGYFVLNTKYPIQAFEMHTSAEVVGNTEPGHTK